MTNPDGLCVIQKQPLFYFAPPMSLGGGGAFSEIPYASENCPLKIQDFYAPKP